MPQNLKWAVMFQGNDMSNLLVIDCCDFNYITENGKLILKLYGVNTITLNNKDVTEICRISSDKVMIINNLKEAPALCMLHG